MNAPARAAEVALRTVAFTLDDKTIHAFEGETIFKAARLMEAPRWDIDTLEDLNLVMTDASICGLGQAAPNPVRCVQKYFAQEIA